MNVHPNVRLNPSSSCQDLSVRTRAVDRPTHGSALALLQSRRENLAREHEKEVNNSPGPVMGNSLKGYDLKIFPPSPPGNVLELHSTRL